MKDVSALLLLLPSANLAANIRVGLDHSFTLPSFRREAGIQGHGR